MPDPDMTLPEKVTEGNPAETPEVRSEKTAEGVVENPPEPQPVPEQTPEEYAKAVCDFAAAQLAEGMPPAAVEEQLVNQGVEPKAARMVVDGLVLAGGEARRVEGRKNIIYGAIWFGGGLLVTLLTMQAANESGGGRFIIAWGAIVFGAIQMFRGFLQSSSN